ncbi:MAG TPA: hypothetical protein VGW36_03655 [Pyrinomonadaceae bacterium]|nr:hypothetical protein [Pyrinomonadaceae bacterium]
MRDVSCNVVRDEIEEAGPGQALGSVAEDHLGNCAGCTTFRTEQTKLRTIVASLGTVKAPSDFDFRLRARLAAEGRSPRAPFALGSFNFGLRSAAFVTSALLVAAVVLVSLRTSDTTPSAVQPSPASDAGLANNAEKTATQPVAETVAATSSGLNSTQMVNASDRPVQKRRNPIRRGPSLTARNASRVKSSDFAASPAPIYSTADLTAAASDFPIAASNRSLTVSLEDGRGSSRTISLPTISFGSQRVLNQNSSTPLVASARGAW